MTPSIVRIRLLERTFEVACPDGRWADLLSELWAPLLVDASGDEPIGLEISRPDERWLLEAPAHEAYSTDPWVIAQILRTQLSQLSLAGSSEWFGLHASVAVTGGIVLLLAGDTRAGKTTLLLDLVAAGWTYGSDDVAPISWRDGTLLAAPKPVHIRSSAHWKDPLQRWKPPPWLPPPTVAALVPAAVFGGSVSRALSATHVVFPRYVPAGAPELERWSSARGIVECLAHSHGGGIDLQLVATCLREICGRASIARIQYPSSASALELVRKTVAGGGQHEV